MVDRQPMRLRKPNLSGSIAILISLGFSLAQSQARDPVKLHAGTSIKNFTAIAETTRPSATPAKEGVAIDARRLKSKRIFLQSLGTRETRTIQGDTFTLKPGQLGIVQTGTSLVPQQILGHKSAKVSGFALPFQILSVDHEGKSRSLEACIDTGNGLSLHAGVPGYSGNVWIAIQDSENRQAGYDFSAPITVILTGLGLDLAPERILFSKANDYQAFKVSSLSPPDPAILNARLTGLPNDLSSATPVVEVTLPVHRPGLEIRFSTGALAGFGLEEATVTVQARGYITPAGHEVALAARGHLAEPVLTLNDQGFAKTTIRSAGVGIDSVQASTSDTPTASGALRYIFPWSFFLSTILGALVGASIERLQSKRPRGTWARRLILGVLAGLAFAVLFAVGITSIQWIQPIAKSGEAVIAAIALAGAFGGFRLVNPAGK